jgi:Kef-type K+ transport system membrane component KefB/mannitol/fructose-specific phosphotransferase system IIA component (Ntr-type)
MRRILIAICALIPSFLFASGGGELMERMTTLVFQLGVIIFVAKFGGLIFEKMKLPSVIGELCAGIVIGPHLLGGIGIPLFPQGLFPAAEGIIPISPELYGMATVASIILLFSAGLESDFNLFVKYSVPGLVLGTGGVVVSFVLGAQCASYFMKVSFFHPSALFLGVMSTATSVGITARILSDNSRLESPQGVTIMAGAVIDDILGIILLAVVIGIAQFERTSGTTGFEWQTIARIAAKTIGFWLTFTLIGVLSAYRISRFLKTFRKITTFSVIALGLALFMAGIFEKAGLAMIVGAYVMGLSLSRTDLNLVIHENLHTLQQLFIPVFFTVMGMLVNPFKLATKEMALFGVVYTGGAILAKLIGCGIPPLFMRFKPLSALLIGLGMVPRGEVALIVAGVGLSHGIIPEPVFGVAILMMLVTTVSTPPLFNLMIKAGHADGGAEEEGMTKTAYAFSSPMLTGLIEKKVIETLREESFYINLTEVAHRLYKIKRDHMEMAISATPYVIEFRSPAENTGFIKNIMQETLIQFKPVMDELEALRETLDMREEIVRESGRVDRSELKRLFRPALIKMRMNAKNKEEAIRELIGMVAGLPELHITEAELFSAVWQRETEMSTGLASGLAIPHAKCDGVSEIIMAVGMKKDGIEFDSIDGQPSRLFILLVSPANVPSEHLLVLSYLTSLFSEPDQIARAVAAKDVVSFFDIIKKA